MREYKILTDSTWDLSPQLVAQTGVTVLPMTYTIGEKSYRNDPIRLLNFKKNICVTLWQL